MIYDDKNDAVYQVHFYKHIYICCTPDIWHCKIREYLPPIISVCFILFGHFSTKNPSKHKNSSSKSGPQKVVSKLALIPGATSKSVQALKTCTSNVSGPPSLVEYGSGGWHHQLWRICWFMEQTGMWRRFFYICWSLAKVWNSKFVLCMRQYTYIFFQYR